MRQILNILFLLSVALFSASASAAAADRKVPVMLSFDTEQPQDRDALNSLRLDVPATYFITGKFAEENRDFVARIAQGNNTIGSHSYAHPHLTKLDSVDMAADLRKSKEVLEAITGKPVVWFRAPFMEHNERVMRTLSKLGFVYDSSDQDRWQRQDVLFELPISTFRNGEMIASDYDLMYKHQLNEEEFGRWLKMLYNEKAAMGQPVMILLHPRMVGRYPDAFNAFIEYVRQEGGEFLSADNYLQRMNRHKPERYAVWVDFSLGEHKPEQILADLSGSGVTDVFLMAKDVGGKRYYGRDAQDRDLFGETAVLLRKKGIKVHAWLPVLADSLAASKHPDWAMVDQSGRSSSAWLSPSNSRVRQYLASTVKTLFGQYALDGLHLDYLRYPGLDADYSTAALQAYALETGRDSIPAISGLLGGQYTEWTNWRASQIASLTEQLRETLRQEGGSRVELSAALLGSAAISYREAETYGQNYSRIAQHLDLLVPMAYFKDAGRHATWISQVVFSARNLGGDIPVMTGVSAYRNEGKWDYTREEFGKALEYASMNADGIAVYPYLYLFGRGQGGMNMPDGSDEQLRQAISDAKSSGLIHYGGISINGIPVVPAVFMVVVLFILNMVAIPVFGKRHHASETGGASGEDEPAKEWRQIDAEMKQGILDGRTAEQVTELLHRFDSHQIQQNRIALVLDVVESHAYPLPELYGLLNNTRDWKPLALRYFHEACLLGYAEIGEHSVELTERGRNVLSEARAEGFDRDFWIFIETCLHATVVVTCPRCGKENLTHFFWNTFECKECGGTIRLRECEQVAVRFSEQASGATMKRVELV
ncbi:hypothetical protein CHL67_05700 [Prosthecochloris sp. GSB1]|uniref:polysaccharide deacetylase family protein n=1 Tax=Prosthecochloris sp. GSB1 TaxID=281093 RepID=UPI000B8C90FB|nr:polysaccharide deacetylase family protein [Prosthecochloris sp. GSB1]ASQ90482.1 hypothetical protein CHL67_05700 [Prosthecochloris sp. GSB1]